MKDVAKVILIDENNNYMMMRRSAHPLLPYDADLPGGIVEAEETPLQAAIREVEEEAGVRLDPSDIVETYAGTDYSSHQTTYSLYQIQLIQRPDITISWEHDSYEWLSLDEFMLQSAAAADTYMHMVHDVLRGTAKHRLAHV